MIAVVDDDEPVRNAVLRLLHVMGYSSRGFASGTELLDAWSSGAPDCLVLDMRMPGGSGLELRRRLRLAGAQVPTILMTGDDEPSVREECMDEGVVACLSKPLDEDVLLGTLERMNIQPDRPSS